MKTILNEAIITRIIWIALVLCIFIPTISSPALSQSNQSATDGTTYVELILDASGSMWNKLSDGRFRVEAAKEVLSKFVNNLPDGDLNVGLRIYGSELDASETGSCEDTKLFVPLAGIDKASLNTTIQDTNARGATPIAKSLLAAADDFPADARKRLIVLVTDGEESCGGDLQAVADDLNSRGFDIDIRIIGFDLTEEAAKSFEGIGTFENAESAEELAEALDTAVEEVVKVRQQVVRIQTVQEGTLTIKNFDKTVYIDDADENFLTSATGKSDSKNFPGGNYTLRSGSQSIENFKIIPGEEVVLDANTLTGRLIIENSDSTIYIDDPATDDYITSLGKGTSNKQLVPGAYNIRVNGGDIENVKVAAGETKTIDLNDHLGSLAVLNASDTIYIDYQDDLEYTSTAKEEAKQIMAGLYSIRAGGGRIDNVEISAGNTTTIDLVEYAGWLVIDGVDYTVYIDDLQGDYVRAYSNSNDKVQLLAGDYSLRLENQEVAITISAGEELVLEVQ